MTRRIPLPPSVRAAALVVPVLCAAPRLGDPGAISTPENLPPPPRAIDVWGGEGPGLSVSPEWWAGRAADRRVPSPRPLFSLPTPPRSHAAATWGLGNGFSRVGSVAVLEGDDLSVSRSGTGFGVNADNLAEISRRFIAAFGDDYDQIAVFLGFTDRLSTQSLAYQMPVKNDVKGLGLGTFDQSDKFGSPSGRMETVLNMKRINVYGRDAANDPDNDLYSVWAQEAAHRWAVYFKYRRAGEAQNVQNKDLLGRQEAHWAPWVSTEASFMDGRSWKDNGDGTFTPGERNKRYGTLDQYAMGLRRAGEVPPFFMLDDLKDEQGMAIDRAGPFSSARRYRARRIDLTVQDIIRVHGPREPASEPAAEDLRMGVVFVTPPGTSGDDLVGEAFRVETTRAPWDAFYNTSGDGRGKVCTELLRPCRGPAFTFGPVTLTSASGGAVAAPGDQVTLNLTLTNAGTEASAPDVQITPPAGLALDRTTIKTAMIAPGASATAQVTGQLMANAPCAIPLKIDLAAAGRLGPSRSSALIPAGLVPGTWLDLEAPDTAATWRIDPDGTDFSTAGAWELGTPEKAVVFDFVTQPAGAYSGTRAFVTGAALLGEPEANDLDFNHLEPRLARTTLESPPLGIAGLNKPHLSYQVHFVAALFSNNVLIPGTSDRLVVSASADGTTWTPIDQLTGLNVGWQRRLVDLTTVLDPATLAAPALRFRFVAEDAPPDPSVVEAVIDDVGIVSLAPSCTGTAPLPGIPDPGVGPGPVTPPGDGGCNMSRGARGGSWFGLALALALAVSLRSRRSGRC
jgi:hypothetical protein